MLAITGASGKLGGATLNALLEYKLVAPEEIVAITSSQPGSATWKGLASKGVQVRHGDFEDGASLESALAGCDRFLLVSTPCVNLDFNDAPEGQGRERHHKTAIDASLRAGVRHLYYSSLGFGAPLSVAGVMRAHLRTERYLASLAVDKKVKVTVLRQGLYNESWPLYLGYFDMQSEEDRAVIPIATGSTGKISWTAIEDLGLANALLVSDPSEQWEGRFFYLSTPPSMAKTLEEVATLVSKARGREVKVKDVGRDEHMTFYVKEKGMDHASVEWWVSSYEAIDAGECLIDDPSLLNLLARKGKKPKSMEDTFAEA